MRIGQLAQERSAGRYAECKAVIDRSHALPLTRQAEILELSRSSLYSQPCPASPADLAIMRRIDERHLAHPFARSRMMRDLLRGEGVEIGRVAVRTMMRRMAIEAISRWRNSSKPAPRQKRGVGRGPYLERRGLGAVGTDLP